VAGFRHAAQRLLTDLHGVHALIVGAGGAAAAAACALIDDGAATITLINRSPDRAVGLASRLDPEGRVIRVAARLQDVAGTHPDIVVNATSLGRVRGEPLPFELETLRGARAVLDLTYDPAGPTPWVRRALQLGMKAEDGREMLIAQGARAFDLWFRTEPQLDVMRAALSAAPDAGI
jgi:shikimate dehydrogenase